MSAIKPIETRYKGYRFRSRLEARWAVFFDALGLEWEYEPQGFDLGMAGWYLPDFWVKDPKSPDVWEFVEIKRENAFKPKLRFQSIYFAGKINEDYTNEEGEEVIAINSWRHELADSEVARLFDKGRFDQNVSGCFYVYPLIRPGITYMGPFFADNHGFPVAHERALDGIEESDIIFCWINSHKAYGTIAEIGYASRAGKFIVIGLSENVNREDLWFVEKFADKSGVYNSPKAAFNDLIEKPFRKPDDEDENKIAKLSCFNSVMLVQGDPVEYRETFYRDGGYFSDKPISAFGLNAVASMVIGRTSRECRKKAAQKARSARFEHGEQG